MRPALSVLLSSAALVGCTTVSPADQTFAYHAGSGVVQSVRPVHVAIPANAIEGSQAAGGSYNTPLERLFRPRWTDGYQLTLRMDDGSTQAVTQSGSAFRPGERVEVTPDGLVSAAPSAPVAAGPAATAPSSMAVVSPYRVGTGTVASIVSEQSASAGSSAPATRGTAPYLMSIRMDDGTTQTIHENTLAFRPGERIRITSDGRLVRP